MFVWVAVLGLRAGSWRMVVIPFLALGALFIARESLNKKFPTFGPQLGASLVTLVIVYNIYCSIPAARSWLVSRFPLSAAATEQLTDDADLRTAENMEPVALAARKALDRYQGRKEDIVGQQIKTELDSLNLKRQQGTFGPADEKKEKEVLNEFQKLVRERTELRRLTVGTAAEQPLQANVQSAQLQESQARTQQTVQPQAPQTPNNETAPTTQPPKTTIQPTASDVVAPTVATPSYRMTPTLPLQGVPSEYDIRIQQCIRQSENINCWGLVKNLTDGTIRLRMNAGFSTFIDDEGNAGKFVAQVATERSLPGTPVRFQFDFHDSHRDVKLLSFELNTEMEADPTPPIRYDRFTFKNVPLQ
jgi:hypothetical protein